MPLTKADYRTLLDAVNDGIYLVDTERRIKFWNKAAEGITGFNEKEVLGRHCADNILRHIDREGKSLCETDCPLAKTLRDGRVREADIYLHHKQGHRVPVHVRIAPVRDENGSIVAAVEVFGDRSRRLAMLERLAELEQTALLDPLTEVGNRRLLEGYMTSCLDELERYGWAFGVLFVDIDHFKRVNDKYGHETGDEVLKVVARVLRANLRSFDLVGRWGGEEFLVVCVNVDDELLGGTAERLRGLVEQSSCRVGTQDIRVTVSIGAALAVPHDTPHDIVNRADRLMYRSKRRGRNRVRIESLSRSS